MSDGQSRMKRDLGRRAGVAMVLFASLMFRPFPVHAQAVPNRLSDWLLEHALSRNDYPLGLSWRVPAEAVSQGDARFDLLKSLSGLDPDVKADAEALSRLHDWIGSFPATGRVPVAVADARWLQANPARDPIILPGHSVVLPQRPRTVTVIASTGKRCQVMHVPGHEAMDYVRKCGSQPIDWAWVAQPDGKVQRFGVAAWNREAQDEPAPGAWIWAPARDGGWPERLSHRLIAFLATQGPSPDYNEASAPTPANPQTKTGVIATEAVRGGASPAWTMPGLADSGNISEGAGDQSGAILPPPAESNQARARSAEVTASDWGSVGLLQSPTARMRKAGHASFHLSRAFPYTKGNVFLQPLDWFEAGFRYTNVSNRLYGPAAFSGDQAYKDKSIDVKFRLWNESAYVPQVAIGLRDIGGTGLFAGEYLVANKRTGDFDWSLGLGWGYVGGRGNLRNPLGRLNPSFDTRKTEVGQGGTFAVNSYFRGPVALFGGVQYQTPWESLILKLEYDGNDYQHEPQANNQKQSLPWNFGAVYRAAPAVDLSFGIERGNTAMFSLTFHTQLDGLAVPKLDDPARVAVVDKRPQQGPDWAATSREIANQTDWHVRSIKQQGRELQVALDDASANYWRERMDRAAAVLHRDAPASVDRFTLSYRERGMAVAEHVIDRDAWVEQRTQALPPSGQRAAVIARSPAWTEPQSDLPVPLYQDSRSAFEATPGMNLKYSFGGPEGFVLYQISAAERAKLRLRDDTWLQGSLQLGLIDNYDKFRYTGSDSSLPRVRTLVREYLSASKVTMPNLQLTHVGRLNENQYYSVYGGYFEEMFAGVGGEWLYRPFGSRLAVGVDANAVQQRDFAQDFSLRNYRVGTGHATLYWDTGWNNVQANVSAGRYLAGDVGGTVHMSRTFQNGVSIGAYFSKTNVTAAQFGEGSYDKGIYVSIPFDAMLTRSSGTVGNFVWKPLTRDGGAKLDRAVTLYDATKTRDDRNLWFKPAPPANHASIPADRRESWSPPAKEPEPYTRVTQKPTAKQWVSDAQRYEQRLRDALYRQQFRNIQIVFDAANRLSVSLANDHLQPISRAVGRVARTALLNAPLETREIRVTFAERVDPVVTYDFIDLSRLQRYFNGELTQAELANYVAVDYINPSAREKNPLAYLDDLATLPEEKRLVDVLRPDLRPLNRVTNDIVGSARTAADTNWIKAGALGTGLVLASSMMDKRADRFAKDHAGSSWLKAGNSVGNALPWLALAGSAAVALDGSDPLRSRTGYTALESGGTALLVAMGLKKVVGRARPWTELGNNNFKPLSGSASNGTDGFPSGHTIITWAVATPFAEEYNAPWLYGVAAVTNLARVGSRQHWVSDTVAGSLLGYGIGKIFWESSHSANKNGFRILPSPSGIDVSWDLK